jgi:hypothetical protein
MPKAKCRATNGRAIEVTVDAASVAPQEFADLRAALEWASEQMAAVSAALGRPPAAPPLESEVALAASNVAHSIGQFLSGLASSSLDPNATVRLQLAPDSGDRDAIASHGWLALGEIISTRDVPDRAADGLRQSLREADELRLEIERGKREARRAKAVA